MKQIIQFFLRLSAKAVLKKYHPVVIGITGSVGKSSAKEAIFAVVSSQFSALRNFGNYNNEIGLPLAVLGMESPGKNILGWIFVFAKVFKMLISEVKFPEILVLEYGADNPGDISYLTSFIKPNIGVVTSIGEIPVHVEFYAGPLEVAKEKQKLISCLGAGERAVLNYDDDTVFEMHSNTLAKVLTFGFGENADVRATDIKIFSPSWNSKIPDAGSSFKINYRKNSISVKITGIFGRPQIYAALSAVCVGLSLDMNLVDIASALNNFKALPGRLNLLAGIKGSWLIDDSYNAAPQSMRAALDILGELKAKRKIAVLGDMRELGKFSFEAHQAVGDRVAQVADILLAIGDKGKIIAEEAKKHGLKKSQVYWFDLDEIDLIRAGKELQEILKPGDLVLFKGSQAMRLEKIIEEVMAEPQRAGQLLVRQDKKWKAKLIV